jgi:FkbM family methyltransferase
MSIVYERIAHFLIGTPVQGLAEQCRQILALPRQQKYPEMAEIYVESDRIKAFMQRTIRDGMNCVDVGCHLGSVLNQMRHLSPSGHHVAIEAIPYKADWLRRKYPEVSVHQLAVGDTPGQVEFYHNPKQSGFSGLQAHGSEPEECHKLSVECQPLDAIVPECQRIGFMKIDVEGAELSVMRGANRILSQDRPAVLFECTLSGLEAFGLRADQVYRHLTNHFQYDIFLIKDWLSYQSPLDLERFEAAMQYPFKAFNFVMLPR